MLYCGNCLTETTDDCTTCPECGARLKRETKPPETRGDDPWIALLRTKRPDSAEIIRGLLESEEIPCEVINKAISEMPVPAATSSYFEIWVPAAQAAAARALLNEAREGTRPCPACGHMSAVEEPRCEYCDAPVVP